MKSDNGLLVKDRAGNQRGYLYHDATGGSFGLLDAGGAWAVKLTNDTSTTISANSLAGLVVDSNGAGIMQFAGATKLQATASGVSGTAFFYSSDERLKENIKTIDSALSKIMKLEGVIFNWKKDGGAGIGLIAQDVEKVFPELVGDDGNGMKSVQYGNLVAPLIEAVKEQQGEIEELRRDVEELRALVE